MNDFKQQPPVLGPPGVIGPPPGAPMWGNQVHQDLAVQHGWSDPGEKKNRWTVPLILLIGLIVLVSSLGVMLRQMNVLPVGVPLIGKDSGVAACQAIAGGQKVTGEVKGLSMTPAEYRKVRSIFADSRYPEIRTNGVALIDLAWQIQAVSPNDTAAALVYVKPTMDAYVGLTGGCAEVGYTLPTLN